MMGKSAFFSEGTAGQMKSACSNLCSPCDRRQASPDCLEFAQTPHGWRRRSPGVRLEQFSVFANMHGIDLIVRADATGCIMISKVGAANSTPPGFRVLCSSSNTRGTCLSSLGSLFCREFAWFTGLVFKAIRGRDGFTRDFGHGRYENLSGAISWLTFFAGSAWRGACHAFDCHRLRFAPAKGRA
jgi:hypothetical protein